MPCRPVMVVDDDFQVLESLQVLLQLHGYAVVTAEDGEQALEVIRSGVDPCVILLDLMMPRKDGFQFRKEQTEDAKLAHIPVVVCSAVFDVEKAAEQLHANGYISKPIDLSTLLALVGRYCTA